MGLRSDAIQIWGAFDPLKVLPAVTYAREPGGDLGFDSG